MLLNMLFPMVTVTLLLFLFSIATGADSDHFPKPCDNDIYCHGPMLHAIQMQGLFKDSKHFVDMSMRHSPSMVRADFQQLMNSSGGQPLKEELKKFVDRNFFEPGKELIPWTPADWKPNPKFLAGIKDAELRGWIGDLHALWKVLGRRVDSRVYLYPNRYSMIYVPSPVIIPGGRFREFYYWDSYWVVKGLLLSDMDRTVRGMILNFVTMVKTFGFVPNGGRIYYSRRSQPPFLIPMCRLYFDKTKDLETIRAILPYLEREMNFWRVNRMASVTVEGETRTVYRYKVDVGQPRPESYREDFLLANRSKTTDGEKEELYADLKTAAESGWDFSTRWFRTGESLGRPDGKLEDLDTRNVVPVDLNALIYYNAKSLAYFYELVKNPRKQNEHDKLAEYHKETINKLLWDEEAGSWFDFDLKSQTLNKRFYPSNIFPIWTGASDDGKNSKFFKYLLKSNATSAVSGVPTSMAHSGEQWDHPNGWPPLQHVVVEALTKINEPEAQKLALTLAQKWINTNFITYMQTDPHAMFEKYNVDQVGRPGHGGEYNVQIGFGWSNAVAMAFLDMFGAELKAPPLPDPNVAAPVGGLSWLGFLGSFILLLLNQWTLL
nr:Treh-E-like protein [Parasacculina yatsui]